jgi:putative ABC transport system permease protein
VPLADLAGERLLAICSALSLAAVLAPLVVLAGLRHGVVEGLRELLLENPHAREIVTNANRTLPVATLERIAARADVQVLIPRTRTLSSSTLLQNGWTGRRSGSS